MTHKSKHAPVITALCRDMGIPAPTFEYRFHEQRFWRFDVAWPDCRIGDVYPTRGSFTKPVLLAMEVEGGIFIAGGHNRGAQIRLDHEKRNAAIELGWFVLLCDPERFIETLTIAKRLLT